jgi:Tfp pilus assembly protein PilF
MRDHGGEAMSVKRLSISHRNLGFVLSAVLLLFACVIARADVTITFNHQDGETVSKTINIRAMLAYPDNVFITKVDIEVDGKVIGTKTATPYEVSFDTLNYNDGPHTITAIATESDGTTVKADLHLIFDNQLSLGADKHAQMAMEALQKGDLDTAQVECARAMKINPNNPNAIRAMAQYLKQSGHPDQAIDMLNKLPIPANDTTLRAMKVSFLVDAADKNLQSDTAIPYLNQAVSIYKEIKKIQSESVPANASSTDKDMLQGDYYASIYDWYDAIQSYKKCGSLDNVPINIANRLALAYINSGDFINAWSALRDLITSQRGDAATHALMGMYYVIMHQPDKARKAVISEVDSDATAPSNGSISTTADWIIAAYADLQSGQKVRAVKEELQAAAMMGDQPEVNLLQAYFANNLDDTHKLLLSALEKNPMASVDYSLTAIEALTQGKRVYDVAGMLSGFGLHIDPTNPYCEYSRALYYLAVDNPTKALPLVRSVLRVNDSAADVHMTLSCLYRIAHQIDPETAELKAANKLDPNNWGDTLTPNIDDLIKRVLNYTYFPLLTTNTLYPVQNVASGDNH